MRYGDATTWQKLHELGLKTASTEDKQYYYDALAFAADPKLLQKSLALTLTDERENRNAARRTSIGAVNPLRSATSRSQNKKAL